MSKLSALSSTSAAVSYRELLEVFFSIHDPTTLNRQGSDVGTQYRSAIFYLSTGQQFCAHEVIDELRRKQAFAGSIVTEIVPAQAFYLAEVYHQGYFENNLQQPYCQFVVSPEVTKFRKRWAKRLKLTSPNYLAASVVRVSFTGEYFQFCRETHDLVKSLHEDSKQPWAPIV